MEQARISTAERAYSPLYFLAALGAGGLVITFFMYLMFWVPHAGRPVPVFEDIMGYFAGADRLGQGMVIVAITGIAVLAVLHYALVIWNLRHFAKFRRSEGFSELLKTNGETQVMAMPLTLAMSVNVGFILGLVYVPGLWSIVEYLFPMALVAFLAIGYLAFVQLARFLGRVLGTGGFNFEANGSFAQVMPAFALSMVAVGLAAPSAMSTVPWIVGTSLALSTVFMVASVVVMVLAIGLGLWSMMQHGTAREAAPTLMVVVPVLTVLGIAMMRQNHGLHTTFEVHGGAGETFIMLSRILAVQILFAGLGLLVLRRQGYAQDYLSAQGTRSAGSYALICPGVALSVMIHFWVNKGLVATGLIAKFGFAFWAFTTPALLLQVWMILLVIKLHRLHFARPNADAAAVPAE